MDIIGKKASRVGQDQFEKSRGVVQCLMETEIGEEKKNVN